MPIRPDDFATGGALLGAAAASLLRERERARLPQPGERIGPFAIVEELGRGGMAVVYRAERADGEYAQTVALKWIGGGGSDEGARALFRRERQALADLSHPHIARLLDGGHSVDGQPWLAMEFIEGQRIDTHARALDLDLRARLRLFLQVGEAVAYAHARGLLHRDIKPSNVLVAANGQAKLLDFGIVQLIGEDDALANHAHTPGYASPEQVRGERLTVAADIYQLGRLLQRLLAGSEAEAEALTSATTVLHAKASEQRFDSSPLPAELRALIACACAAEPAQRYATVEALMADVRAFLELRPLRALPRRGGYRLRKFLQRHRYSALAAGLVLLALTALGTWSALRVRAERDLATYQAQVATTALEFLTDDLLAAASPEIAQSREISVREALDRAAESVGTRFAEAPLEQLTVRQALAALYQRLGRLDESLRELEQAQSLLPRLPEARRDEVQADLALQRAWLDLDRGDLDALAAYVDAQPAPALMRLEAGALPMAMERVRLQALLAWHRGDYARAEALQSTLLALSADRLGEDALRTARIRQEHTDSLRMLGRDAEVVATLRRLRTSYAAALGELHPDTISAELDLGVALRHAGSFDEALQQLQAGRQHAEAVLGARHAISLRFASETATVLQELKRYDEAEPLFETVLAGRLELFGEANALTRNAMANLGLLHVLQGQLDKAAPLYERVLALELELLEADHPDTLSLMHNLGGLYRRQGRFDEALAMHARAVEGAGRKLGARAWQTGMFEIGRALSLEAAARPEAADAAFAEAIAILGESLGPEHARTLRAIAIRDEARAARP
ncbi:serine/threonine-protein kinase [Aquimonas voraii]|uniref:Serine/threonine protein kinase n=1 Tax=Aquimonas voraii TaxID=265719 RepID=A0A1G6X599_9GAMM|nr:serine/threonine-protein kinase [Aquimonas voraii]SDD73308.1 serine/threonine protein kinase [Aquimonas voraii]